MQASRPFSYSSAKSFQDETLKFIADWTTKFLRNARPTNSSNLRFLAEYFSSSTPHNLLHFLCRSSTWDRARQPGTHPSVTSSTSSSFAVRQASAKLHVLYGKPLLKPFKGFRQPGSRVDYTPDHNDPYPYAVSMVYDLRNYTEETMWGPYLGDGKASVDWEKMEAIMLLLEYNAQVFKQSVGEDNMLPIGLIAKHGWVGAHPGSYKSVDILGDTQTEEFEEVEEDGEEKKEPVVDPYNISGTWMRVGPPLTTLFSGLLSRLTSGLTSRLFVSWTSMSCSLTTLHTLRRLLIARDLLFKQRKLSGSLAWNSE